jgi:hypothetical protein
MSEYQHRHFPFQRYSCGRLGLAGEVLSCAATYFEDAEAVHLLH